MSRAQPDGKEIPFLDHLEELRWRIVKSLAAVAVGAAACFAFSRRLLDLIVRPATTIQPPPKIIYLSPAGMFMVMMTVSIVGGIIVALPFVFYEAWQFVAPGLLEREKRHVPNLVLASTLAFLAGTAFAYFAVIPIGLRFFARLSTPTIVPQWDVRAVVGFVWKMGLAFGVLFQLPVLSFLLTRAGLLRPEFLRRKRRYSVVIILIIAAVLTPPDVVSQIMMAVPLLLLYEVSVWISVISSRKGTRAESAANAW